MERSPKGQDEAFEDGVGAEAITQIVESNPSASKETLVDWEKKEFGTKGDEPINEDEQVRLIQ